MEKEDRERIQAKIARGTWHDGRLDCVAGNGIISELGIGDEPMLVSDESNTLSVENAEEKLGFEEVTRKQSAQDEIEAVDSLPIVVIRNYSVRVGSNGEELLTVLAQWAATLAENRVRSWLTVDFNACWRLTSMKGSTCYRYQR